MHPGRPYRPAGRASVARPPAAGHRLAWLPSQQAAARVRLRGGLRARVPGRVGEGRHAILGDVRAPRGGHRLFLYRRPISIITGPLASVGDDITRLLQMSTAGPGRTGPNGLTLPPKLTAGAACADAAAYGPPGRPRGGRAVLDAPGRSWGRLGPASPRTTIISSGAPRAWVTVKATGTPLGRHPAAGQQPQHATAQMPQSRCQAPSRIGTIPKCGNCRSRQRPSQPLGGRR